MILAYFIIDTNLKYVSWVSLFSEKKWGIWLSISWNEDSGIIGSEIINNIKNERKNIIENIIFVIINKINIIQIDNNYW